LPGSPRVASRAPRLHPQPERRGARRPPHHRGGRLLGRVLRRMTMHTWRTVALAVAAVLALGAAGCGDKGYEFDEVALGGDGEARTPKARSNSQFVRAIYTDLLGRAPESYDFVVTDADGNELTRFPVDEQQYLVDALDG